MITNISKEAEVNDLFENAKGDPDPLKDPTFGLKSIVSDARKPFFK